MRKWSKRRLVGDERGLVALDREAEEEREVGLHLREAVGRQLAQSPPAPGEGRAHRGRRSAASDSRPGPPRSREDAEHAVGRVDELVRERAAREHLARPRRASCARPTTSRRRERRADRLRAAAALFSRIGDLAQAPVGELLEHRRPAGVGVAPDVAPVEEVVRAPVPEDAVEEDSADGGRRVAPGDLQRVRRRRPGRSRRPGPAPGRRRPSAIDACEAAS